MAQKILGVDVTRTTTTAEHELGLVVDDAVGGANFGTAGLTGVVVRPGNVYKYVKANAAVAAGDAVKLVDSSTNEPGLVTPTTALNDVVDGIAHVAIALDSFGFITILGRVTAAKVGTVAFGDRLGASGTAGTLTAITIAATPTQGEVQRVLAAAVGIAPVALDADSSGTAEVQITK